MALICLRNLRGTFGRLFTTRPVTSCRCARARRRRQTGPAHRQWTMTLLPTWHRFPQPFHHRRRPMTPTAAYDEIADGYEQEFLGSQRARDGIADADPLGINRALRDLLGQGTGTCLEIGCGTGVHAARVRELGWTPVGVDLSAGMLRHARGRLALARADAERL